MIDTHAHLDDEQFQNDLPGVLDRARAAGIERIVTIATTAASSQALVDLAKAHKMLIATVGIQPNNVAQALPGDWDRVLSLVDDPSVHGVGETGLDRYWDYTPFAQQEDYFARHLALARRHDLPVVIHCRQAEADVVRQLRSDYDQHGSIRGIMHSFTGDWPTAEACIQMGLYISFAGMLTYKNAQALREVAAKIPHDRLLVETDSPYLAPVPMRGKRNEPAFVTYTAASLAGLHGLSIAALAEETTRNAKKLFKLE